MAEDIGGVLVGVARGQGTGEILHRTVSRVPRTLAIAGGEAWPTCAEPEAAVSRTAAAPAADGITKGDRLALLSPWAKDQPGQQAPGSGAET